jgi:salicylate hydroxylase
VDIDLEKTEVLVATGDREIGDLIVAADGVKSTIKHRICSPEALHAKSTGEAAYRFTIPRNRLEAVADESLLALVQRPWARRWDGPAGHVVAYPVRNHQLLNVVLIHPDNDQTEESWTTITEKENVAAAFSGWNQTIHKLVDLAPTQVPNFRLFLYPPSPVWAQGSTILLGDSCHAML